MIRILINHCKDILKKQKRTIPAEDLSETEAQVTGDGTRQFRELIEPLREQDRSIFTLYYVYGLKVKEIASYMEMKENTVATRLKRGREALRDELTANHVKGTHG